MDTTNPTGPREPATSPEPTADGVRALVRWAATLEAAAIPEAARRRSYLILCDDIAAIVAARDEAEVAALQVRMAASGGVAEATVFRGGRPRTDRYSAAVANGAACDWCELDEGYRKATCHAGLYTVPALVAEAEATGRSVEDVMRALTIGYEVAARFARAFHFKKLTLHPHASLAAIGAAAGIAALRRVPEAQFLAAVTAAATMVAPGPFNHAVTGALVRNVWPAAGAWCGMRAVDWAECGIGGLAQSPYHVFVDAFGAEARPAEFTAGLGGEWAVGDGYHKLHACCQYSHSAVEATLDLLGRAARRPEAGAIRRITVETHRLGQTLDNRSPATTLAAKFSMAHIVAATCALGHAGAEAFAGSTLADPTIAGLRERVTLAPFLPEQAWPLDRPARVTLDLTDGTRLQGECLSARGGPDRPFSTEEILAKIGKITAGVYPAMAGVAQRLIALDPATARQSWRDTVGEITGVTA
ncbi:MAG: MmgE/PrpD family protein [Alphaproteobacteria bacterium]|nr:MmgE/PrpD family protein [Alphaproteobacteria bacterium]